MLLSIAAAAVNAFTASPALHASARSRSHPLAIVGDAWSYRHELEDYFQQDMHEIEVERELYLRDHGINWSARGREHFIPYEELPPIEELNEACFLIGQGVNTKRMWSICTSPSTAHWDTCIRDEGFTAYYGQPIYLCEFTGEFRDSATGEFLP